MMATQVAQMLHQRNETLDSCCSLELLTGILMGGCSMFVTDEAPELCADLYIQTYGLDTAQGDKERALKFTDVLGTSEPTNTIQFKKCSVYMIIYMYRCYSFDLTFSRS